MTDGKVFFFFGILHHLSYRPYTQQQNVLCKMNPFQGCVGEGRQREQERESGGAEEGELELSSCLHAAVLLRAYGVEQ